MKKYWISLLLLLAVAFAPLGVNVVPAEAAKVLYSTNAQSTLSGSINNSTTTVVVASASSFPSISGGSGDWFVIKIDSELMKVTATSGATFTVVRAFEGTSAASHTGGVTVTGVLTAAMLDQLKLDANIPGISGNSGTSFLGSPFTLNASTGTYQDTGLSVSVPAAGTYLMIWRATALLGPQVGFVISIGAKLFNSTASADVANSEIPIFTNAESTSQNYWMTGGMPVLVTVVAASTIKLYANRTFSGTPANSAIETAQITWLRIN